MTTELSFLKSRACQVQTFCTTKTRIYEEAFVYGELKKIKTHLQGFGEG